MTKAGVELDIRIVLAYLGHLDLPRVVPGGGAVPDGLVAGLGERPTLGALPGGRVLVLHALLVVPLLL